jgi:hypothetical protein
LDHLTSRLVIAPQDGPTCAVGLDERQLEFRAEYPELALLRLDAREQRELFLKALVVCSLQVEVDECRLEVDDRSRLVNLL